jgi:acetyl-CoA carboxylase biotin carboxyl carrier protein
VDLTSDDVQDILQLLDGLPFGEMHLRTTRFSLWLRRTDDGDWTQELQVLSEPTVIPATREGGEGGVAGARQAPGSQAPGAPEPGSHDRDTQEPGSRERGTQVRGTQEPGALEPGTQEPGSRAPGAQERDGLRAVRAPLPGTFYRAPMPGAPPFVELGRRVEPDTVVGIVETMKLMNSVPAGVGGTVAEIPLANAAFAERDAVLMWIQEDP